MIKVLDLFAGTQSVRKALNEMYKIVYWHYDNGIHYGYDENQYENPPIIEYIGIDIYSPEAQNIHLDLTQDNIVEKLKEVLGDWKPDFIWASPLCTPFSRATSIVNGTLAYRIIDGILNIRTAEEFKEITHKAYVKHIEKPEFIKKHQELGRIGLALFNNTKEIINYYNVPFAIENPAMATSKYILKEYIKNDTTYCMYGFDYKKRTSIYSNKKLNLKVCNHKGNHKLVMSGSPAKTGLKPAPSNNKDRSIVPPKLIKEIITQLTKENNE